MSGGGSPGDTAAVVLAAGEGRRFKAVEHKLLWTWEGLPLIVHAVTAPVAAGFAAVVVVAGAVPLGDVLAEHDLDTGVQVVENPDWRDGLASSLACGLDAVAARGLGSAVVGLGDMPAVTAADWREVAAAVGTPIAVTRWADGDLSPPVRLDASVWADLPRTGDVGARALWTSRPELVTQVPRPGTGMDVDTVPPNPRGRTQPHPSWLDTPT
ncbi:MAG: NTP transferase domain-containing protein [Acidimicrobiia bacterium]|nr:NTP transferase domain-containing protein [Acidimicrobiia bacterium]